MDNIIWNEIKRFIKDNYKKILVISLVIGLVYTLITNVFFNAEETMNDDDSSDFSEELAVNYSGFQVYIEYDDGRSFANTTLLEDYIIQPEVIEEAEAATGVEIAGPMEELAETGFEKSGQNRGLLGVTRGNYSDVFTVLVNVGTDDENLDVAEYYFEELTEGNVNFLQNKEVYVWTEPALLETDEEETAVNAELTNDINGNSVSSYIFDMVIGTVFGFVVSLLVVLFWSILRDRKIYSFSYNRGSEDVFLLYDDSKDNADELAQLIVYPLSMDKVVVYASELPAKLKVELRKKAERLNEPMNIDYVSKISDARIVSERTEIVIVLNSDMDSKKWYKSQRKLADTYKMPVKVVQINS